MCGIPKIPSLHTLLIYWYFSMGIVRGFQSGPSVSGDSCRLGLDGRVSERLDGTWGVRQQVSSRGAHI